MAKVMIRSCPRPLIWRSRARQAEGRYGRLWAYWLTSLENSPLTLYHC